MPSKSIAYVFIDANTALHFKRPSEIDWQLLTGAGAIVLVAAPILLRELEKQKIFNPSRKHRERCNAYVRWLHSFLVNPISEVRPGVRWLFLPDEPTIDFAAERLSPNISDDHLIASVLDFTPEPPGTLFVATADIGLEAKLRARRIAILALPDGARLPPEPDPVEQENRALRQQIARIEARMPKLSVGFGSGGQHHTIHLARAPVLDIASLAQMKAKHPFMEKQGNKPSLREGLAAPVANLQHLLGISGDQVDAYNRELTDYYDRYGRYLASLEAWWEHVHLRATIKLVLGNDGSAPASNIDLDLCFPEWVTPVAAGNIPKKPEPPKAPDKPHPLMNVRGLGEFQVVTPTFLNSPGFSRMFDPTYDGVPVIDQDQSTVRISLSNLKHGFTRTCDPFLICFAGRQALSNFHIDYHLSAAEIPDATTGELHIRIENTEG